MSPPQVDYAALAKQAGVTSSTPPGGIDYTALAQQAGAISSTPSPATQTELPARPGFLKRLGQSLGLPTSKEELQQMQANEDALPLWQKMLPHAPGSSPSAADSIAQTVLGPAYPAAKSYAQTAAKGIKEGGKEALDAGGNIAEGGPVGANLGKAFYGGLHGALQATPIVGPSIDTAGQDIAQGNYAGGAGGLTGVVGQVLGPKMARKVLPNSFASRVLMLGRTPEGAYESALKPSTTMAPAERAGIVSTGLQEGIPVSKAGLQDIGNRINALNDQIRQTIQTDPTRPIDPQAALQNLGPVRQRFTSQVNPRADLAAIDASGQEFAENQHIPPEGALGPVPPMNAADAQAMKQGTYRALGDKAYGEVGSASKEAQKALARGLKDELARQFPQLSDLNARDSRLIDLQDSLERAVGRIGNHQLLGIGTPIAGAAASAVTGSPGIGKIAMVMKAVLDNPTVKSKLAIAISQGKIPSPMVVPKIAAYYGSLSRLSGLAPQPPQSQQPPSDFGGASANQ